MSAPVEVGRLTRWDRAWLLVALVVATAVCAWGARTFTGKPQVIECGLAVFAAYMTLSALRLPSLLARADDAGIDYTDMRRGWIFLYGHGHAAWSDVIAIETRRRWSISPWWIQRDHWQRLFTRVTVRRAGGSGVARITVHSEDPGYMPLIEALHAHASAAGGVELRGMGVDPARIEEELSHTGEGFAWKLGLVVTSMAAYFALQYWTRR